ncbi:MAG: ThiF family adenylyltransferase [Actinomycetota bacterium]|nr:ThiF family adenylyltransferase [Actinomycetota bacterium]
MSKQLISRSADLKRLRDDGYDIEIRSSYLVVKGVPYVTAQRTVAYGLLVSELSTSGDTTTTPATHEIFFVGSIPCDHHGNELTQIINQRGEFSLAGDLKACCSFSRKSDPAGYPDYYEKVVTSVALLEGYARAIDDTATARRFVPVETDEDESVFRYLDSASSRARIGAVTEKLQLAKVVIVGLGGTGSYILDLVAKTPVNEIHLYDGDRLFTHNAFRAPGAASLGQLRVAPKKVHYFRRKYDPMRRAIIAHAVHVDDTNIEELRDASFVFLAMDGGPAKRYVIEHLEQFGVPFIDTGMGIYQAVDALGGIVRTTTSDNEHRSHIWEKSRISFADAEADEYEQNIQIADLNMLNAALAVIKWKKLFGFYTDFEHEYSSMYTIDGNHLLNEDQGA